MENNTKYILIAIGIIVIIYLLWQNSDNTYNYEKFAQITSPNSPLQTGPYAQIISSLHEKVRFLHQKILILKQKMRIYQQSQVPQHLKDEINKMVPVFNEQITTINTDLNNLTGQLNAQLVDELVPILDRFNYDINLLNSVISPVTNQRIILIQVPPVPMPLPMPSPIMAPSMPQPNASTNNYAPAVCIPASQSNGCISSQNNAVCFY